MDYKDLMIGDWVLHSGKPKKVECIWFDGCISLKEYPPKTCSSVYTDKYHADTLGPVPLTEEILVKNGFVGVELTDSYELNTDYYEIEIWNYSDGLWVVNVHWIEFSSTPESKATVSYVHQLQHLLRLCGIEKEIEL